MLTSLRQVAGLEEGVTPERLVRENGVAALLPVSYRLCCEVQAHSGKIYKILPLPGLKKSGYVRPSVFKRGLTRRYSFPKTCSADLCRWLRAVSSKVVIATYLSLTPKSSTLFLTAPSASLHTLYPVPHLQILAPNEAFFPAEKRAESHSVERWIWA